MNVRRHHLTAMLALSVALLAAGCQFWPLHKRALSNSEPVRTAALEKIKALGEREKAALVPHMISALSAPDGQKASYATDALTAIGAPALPGLFEVAKNPDPFLRTVAVAIMGDLGNGTDNVLPQLIGALMDQHPLVREEAAYALGRLGTTAQDSTPALVLSLKDPDPDVREAAKNALTKIGASKNS